jgi:hypothetical protein
LFFWNGAEKLEMSLPDSISFFWQNNNIDDDDNNNNNNNSNGNDYNNFNDSDNNVYNNDNECPLFNECILYKSDLIWVLLLKLECSSR